MIRLKTGFRRFAAAALCIVLALTAAGCGGKGSDNKKTGSQTNAVSSVMPEITSKDGVVTSKMVSFGEDFLTDGMQVLAMENDIFYAFNYSYEGDGFSAYELVQFKEDGSGLKKATYKVEDEDATEVTASAFKDGYYYLGLSTTSNSPALDYALENELDAEAEIPDDLSEDAVSTFQIACVSPDGKQKWIADVREPAEEMYFYIESILVGDEGIYVVSTEGVDIYSTEDGSYKETLCSVSADDLTGILRVTPDGKVFMVNDTGSATKVQLYDAAKGEFKDSITLPGALMGATVFGGRQYDLYMASEDGIYGAKFGSDKLAAVVNYVNSDLDVEGITSLIEIGEGRFAVQAYGSEVTLDTYVLEMVAPEDVKDRKEITLGGYYISYDVRSEVIQFNKENSEFRITIQDYSQYDLAEDEYDSSTGLSRMNTDIVSGNVPDILVMSDSMPVNNYISKGMMMDLTERYESDPDIKRSDFMQNVMDAFKTDDRMYVIVPGFTVTGIAGKAKYIGDGKDLTITRAKEIAAGMGLDETGVFGVIDRESVLAYAIQFSGDQFMDMDKHTCDFNNSRFQELLEFANKFPAQIGDDVEYDYSTQFLADKALLGIQFINTPFDYYYMTRQLYGDINMTITGFPSDNNKGPAVAPSFELGISSSASDPDGCWSFARRFLLPDYQGRIDSCLPVSKTAIKAMGDDVIKSFKEQELANEEYLREQNALISEEEPVAEDDSSIGLTGDDVIEVTDDLNLDIEESEDMTGKPMPEKDFDGTHEEYEEYLKDFEKDASAEGEEEIIIEPLEEENSEEPADTYGLDSLPQFGQTDLDNMQKVLDNLSFSVNSENEVLGIILEEAGAYFAGQKSTTEVSDIIQSRISVYLKENE